MDGKPRWPRVGKTGQLPHPFLVQGALSWSLNLIEISPMLLSVMHISWIKRLFTMHCAIACIDLKMLLDKKWLTWKFRTNSGRTAAEHMLNTASVRTENGGVEFHTHGNRKLRNSFHTYDNRKVCPSFNLFLKSTFSLTLGKNNGTALVVWQPTAGRHKGWQPQGAPAGAGEQSSLHANYLLTQILKKNQPQHFHAPRTHGR